LDNGVLQFSGDHATFFESELGRALAQDEEPEDKVKSPTAKPSLKALQENLSESVDTTESSSESEESETESDEEGAAKTPRKLIEEESRAVGRVKSTVWKTYFGASGNAAFWLAYVIIFVGAKLVEVGETWWLRSAQSQFSLGVLFLK
jgi:hypothetical protein